jgi:hypothetical protein
MEQPQPLVIEIVPFEGYFDEDEIPDRGNNFGRHADIADNFGDASTILGDEVDEIMSVCESEGDEFFFGDLDFGDDDENEDEKK